MIRKGRRRTPDLEYEFTRFAGVVRAGADRAARRAEDAAADMAADSAMYAEDVARHARMAADAAANAADTAKHAATDAASAVVYAKDTVRCAVATADAAVRVVYESYSVRPMHAAANAANAAVNATNAVPSRDAVHAMGAAELRGHVRQMATAAVAALDTAAAVFDQMEPAATVLVRRPGRVTVQLVELAVAALPAVHRARYAEEWLSLLAELPTHRARAGHVLSILSGAPRQAWTLRRPLKPAPPARHGVAGRALK
ncbi:hypothetical protein [Actinomadura sp. 6N118]|uniref:hypothetical protein n=1 Tax=Actinomadura sp. 6N118 TaxID=3375151 RepID=UPI0037A156F0